MHALAQVVTFVTESSVPTANFVKALNDNLPAAVRVLSVEEVAADFHARYSARGKTYRYRIFRQAICPPFLAKYVWHYPFPLDEVAMIAAAGLVVIGATKVGAGLGVAFFLVLVGAFFWGAGNTVAKHVARQSPSGKVDAMNFIAWTSVAAVPPLVLISLLAEPANSLLLPITKASWALAFHLCVLAYAAQVFGYGLWSNLLTRYPASAVSPFALWVPVAGMSATALVFNETLSVTQIMGALVVMIGLAVAVFGATLLSRLSRPSRVS